MIKMHTIFCTPCVASANTNPVNSINQSRESNHLFQKSYLPYMREKTLKLPHPSLLFFFHFCYIEERPRSRESFFQLQMALANLIYHSKEDYHKDNPAIHFQGLTRAGHHSKDSADGVWGLLGEAVGWAPPPGQQSQPPVFGPMWLAPHPLAEDCSAGG